MQSDCEQATRGQHPEDDRLSSRKSELAALFHMLPVCRNSASTEQQLRNLPLLFDPNDMVKATCWAIFPCACFPPFTLLIRQSDCGPMLKKGERTRCFGWICIIWRFHMLDFPLQAELNFAQEVIPRRRASKFKKSKLRTHRPRCNFL